MATNDGKLAERWFEAHWESFGKEVFCCRLADHHSVKYQGGLKNVNVISGANPSDYLIVNTGVTHFAEVKSTENAQRFAFSNIKPKQWQAARRTVAAKGDYYFYLLNLKTNDWYKVPAHYLLDVKDSERQSVKWSEIERFKLYILVDKPTK